MFRSLKTLDLIGNQLTSLPHSVSELDSLETLFLNNNQFLQIPTELLSIPRLAYIDLSNSEGEDRPTQNRIDYIYEIETLRALLKKESIKNVRIEVDNKAEMQKIITELNDVELQKKLSFHYYFNID